MARVPFLLKFTKKVPGEGAAAATDKAVRTTFSCVKAVQKKLDIPEESVFIPNADNTVDRKGYTRKYENAAGEEVSAKSVADGKIPYLAYGKANSRQVFLKMLKTAATGATKAKYRTLAFTFPSAVNVALIGEALAEIIPESKRDMGTLSAGNVESFFYVKGGRAYPLPTAAKAETGSAANVAETEAEVKAVLDTTKSS